MNLKEGDIVIIDGGFLNTPKYEIGFIYDTYKIGSNVGVNVITKEAVDLGGFNEDECEKHIHKVSEFHFYNYHYRNQISFHNDIQQGMLDNEFNILKIYSGKVINTYKKYLRKKKIKDIKNS